MLYIPKIFGKNSAYTMSMFSLSSGRNSCLLQAEHSCEHTVQLNILKLYINI